MEEDESLKFQRYAHDRTLGGSYPADEGQPAKKTRHVVQLAPRAFHDICGNKTIESEIEKALRGLERLLVEDKED